MAFMTSSVIARRFREADGRVRTDSNVSGSPTRILIFATRGTLCPGGSTRAGPDKAPGVTGRPRPAPDGAPGIPGRPELGASQPMPGLPRYSRPSGDLVPSG